ncbi:MAG: 23S rRNA (guanosine(2251)-2'-O)-methyltransferase RlmB [Burkholderiales bacterium]
MSKTQQVLYGFHAVTARLRHAPESIKHLYVDPSRRDKRMLDFLRRAEELGIKPGQAEAGRLRGLAHTERHQGVVALAEPLSLAMTLHEVLDALPSTTAPLLLVLDSITDPHNLGACLRAADGAGAHAVIAPKDRAVGLSSAALKAASGAADSMPFVVVTNLARSLRDMKEAGIHVVGTSDDATKTIYEVDWCDPVALVMGAEGEGMRRLTREICDELVSIPMQGAVESLNVSVASAVCLYEARRQRGA